MEGKNDKGATDNKPVMVELDQVFETKLVNLISRICQQTYITAFADGRREEVQNDVKQGVITREQAHDRNSEIHIAAMRERFSQMGKKTQEETHQNPDSE